ncbi:MAG: hypothetical protein ACXWD7_00925 [Solirubrobacterales bacterium]
MAETRAPRLHPAEHRAYRELYAAARQLLSRWSRLSEAIADTEYAGAIDNAALRVRELLEALEPRTAGYELHGRPAAQGVGARIGDVRSAVVDRSLDTGMAVRLAVLDIEHVVTLLGQLASLARARGDDDLERFCTEWEKRLRPEVKAVRKAAVELGGDPDRTARPLDDSPLGQAIHRAGWALGTLGEWFDRTVASRSGDASDERKAAQEDE